jgi:dipeptidyl aminopeptidase/acylaminoacyl peptidase
MSRTLLPPRAAFAVLAFLAACAPARAPQAGEPPSAEAYMAAPRLSGLVASKQGDRIAWLSDDRGEHQVWSAVGPAFAPKLVARWSGDDGRPLSELAISDDGSHLAFVRGDDEGAAVNPTSDPRGAKQEIWTVDAAGAAAAVLVGEGLGPVFAPDGKSVTFHFKGELHATPVDHPADAVVFHANGKQGGPVWSPDGARFAFVSHRGDHSLVGVFDPAAQRITWMAPGVDRDEDPVWSPDGKRLAFLRFRGRLAEAPLDVEFFAPRTPVSIVVADATSGEGRVVVAEDASGGFAQRDSTAADSPLLWAQGDRLVFPSERDGWLRLWSARADGSGEPIALTPASCEAEAPALGPDHASVIVATNCGDLERRHLMRIPAAGGPARALTSGRGIEWGPVSTTSGATAYVGSAARDVPGIVVQPEGAAAPKRITPDAAALHMPAFVEPETVTFKSDDGVDLHGQLFLPPPDRRGAAGKKMPALIFVHGGPVRQMLAGWHPMGYYHHTYAMNQYLASRGYAVLAFNYRLGVGYGRAYRRLETAGPAGSSELRDVQSAAHWFAQRADVDASRLGIWGGSYGGLLTALSLSRDSATFHAGVDLCGVHDWSRFIREELHGPDAERLARASSPVASVAGWTSPVLFVHGDDDHTVPFSQTVDLVQRLRDYGKAHVETLVFPDEQHGSVVHAHRVTTTQRIGEFFDRSMPGR